MPTESAPIQLQAPDSMKLRLELVARMKPEHPHRLTEHGFKEVQKVIGTLRRARQKLERLGFYFEDKPFRGRG